MSRPFASAGVVELAAVFEKHKDDVANLRAIA